MDSLYDPTFMRSSKNILVDVHLKSSITLYWYQFDPLLRFTSASSGSSSIVSRFGFFRIALGIIGFASYLIFTFSSASSSWYIWIFSAMQSLLKGPFCPHLKHLYSSLSFLVALLLLPSVKGLFGWPSFGLFQSGFRLLPWPLHLPNLWMLFC